MADSASPPARRELHFANLEAMLAEAKRLASAPRVVAAGNWSLGQILHHLAAGFTGSLDGLSWKPKWYQRLIGPLVKSRVLRRMPSGFKLPVDASQTLVPRKPVSPVQGLAELQAAVARFQVEEKIPRHPLFGAMTDRQWTTLHLRHAELHLGFITLAD
ncbi:DUF1569 domain-containing protein [Lignipirellula cremea]|uniref:DinB superfamily protein n=1 Tax=Lignipirellula cremea TaxID=2528010 RepID=A0A518DUM7_9BACT|nr:DUF1569 domain-containing protein [Lignipirellula cremea]QDU95542.1 hypothetical protein Pla8534_33570 [Lignipirellula cremea]